MTKTVPVNIGRNIAVRTILEKAFAVMEMVSEPLELWCIAELAPEVRDSFEPNEEKRVNVSLGQLTRNHRVEFNTDQLLVSLDGKTVVKLPYGAIYCIVTAGVFAQDLNWIRVKDGDTDVAHVNLVEGFHGIPKYAK